MICRHRLSHEDVEGAVTAIHALHPDVVLLDVHLPGGDGKSGAEVMKIGRAHV